MPEFRPESAPSVKIRIWSESLGTRLLRTAEFIEIL